MTSDWQRTLAGRWRSVALLGAAIVAALAYDPRAPSAAPKRVALVALAGAVAIAALFGGRTRVREGPSSVSSILVAAFAAWSVLALIWSHPAGALDACMWIGGAVLTIACGRARRTDAIRVASLGCAVIGGGAASFTVVTYALGGRGMALHGGQGNPDWLGILLAVTLLPTAAQITLGGRAWARALVALSCAAQLAGLALAGSRAGAVGVACGCVTAAIVARARSEPQRRLAGWVVAGAIAACAAFGVVGMGALPRDAAAVEAVGPLDDANAALRGRAWIAAVGVAVAKDAPLQGHGLGTFAGRFLEEQGARLVAMPSSRASRAFTNATTAHDDWLQVLSELGVPGFVLLLGALLVAAHHVSRSHQALLAGALVAFSVTAIADAPWHQPAVVVVLALLLGAARPSIVRTSSPARAVLRERRVSSWNLPRGSITRVAAGGALVVASLSCARATTAWFGAVAHDAALREEVPEARVAALRRAATVDRANGEILLDLGLAELALDRPHLAVPSLRASLELLPNAGTHVALGNALVALEHRDDAIASYRTALRLQPGSMRAHANLGATLAEDGRFEEAQRHVATARRMWPGHPTLARIEDRVRRLEADASAR